MAESHEENKIIQFEKPKHLPKKLLKAYDHSYKRIPVSQLEGVNNVLAEYDNGIHLLSYAEYNRICTEYEFEDLTKNPFFSMEVIDFLGGIPPSNPAKIKETPTSKIYLLKREGIHLFLYSGIVRDKQKFEKMYLLYGRMAYKLAYAGTSDEVLKYYLDCMVDYYQRIVHIFEHEIDKMWDEELYDTTEIRQRKLINAFFEYKWISTWNESVFENNPILKTNE